MISNKNIVSIILILIIATSTMGFAFAQFSGYLTVEFDKDTANVGDTVTMTVTASNEGLDSWYPVKIYAPIPSGMQYVSHIVPDKTLQNYNPSTGIWDVNRMRHDERGHLKTLIITLKVLPEAAGKTIKGKTSFQTLMLEGTGEDLIASGKVPASRTATITVPVIAPVASFTALPLTGTTPLTFYFTDTSTHDPTSWSWDFDGDGIIDSTIQNPTHTYSKSGTYIIKLTASNSGGKSTRTIFITVKDGTDPGTGGGTGGGNGNGTGRGNGSNSGLGSTVGLLKQQTGGGGGNGKTYEVFNSTSDHDIDPQDMLYGLAALIIMALIFLGYLYESKKKQ